MGVDTLSSIFLFFCCVYSQESPVSAFYHITGGLPSKWLLPQPGPGMPPVLLMFLKSTPWLGTLSRAESQLPVCSGSLGQLLQCDETRCFITFLLHVPWAWVNIDAPFRKGAGSLSLSLWPVLQLHWVLLTVERRFPDWGWQQPTSTAISINVWKATLQHVHLGK